MDPLKRNKCENLHKKIIVKELNQPWSESDDEDVVNDSFDSNYDEYEFPTLKESDEKKDFKMRMCLCKLNKSISYVYSTQFDAVEIEYYVKLNKADELNKIKVNFAIKYEIVNRNCEDYVHSSRLSNGSKGRIICDKANKYGIQKELYDMANEKQAGKLPRVKPNSSVNVLESKDEAAILKYLLVKNLNFHCKFNLQAPVNEFINIGIYIFFL